jgi:hypothetical protein
MLAMLEIPCFQPDICRAPGIPAIWGQIAVLRRLSYKALALLKKELGRKNRVRGAPVSLAGIGIGEAGNHRQCHEI